MGNHTKIALAMLILLPLPLLQGCGDDPTGPGVIPAKSRPGTVDLPGLAVFPDSLDLSVGQSSQLGVFLEVMGDELVPPELQVTWSSSDPDVVTVLADGTVIARREGKALVEAYHGEFMGKALVIVPGEAHLSPEM